MSVLQIVVRLLLLGVAVSNHLRAHFMQGVGMMG